MNTFLGILLLLYALMCVFLGIFFIFIGFITKRDKRKLVGTFELEIAVVLASFGGAALAILKIIELW